MALDIPNVGQFTIGGVCKIVLTLSDKHGSVHYKVGLNQYLPTVALAIPIVDQSIIGGFWELSISPNILVNDSFIICREATDMITAKITMDTGSSFVLPAIHITGNTCAHLEPATLKYE